MEPTRAERLRREAAEVLARRPPRIQRQWPEVPAPTLPEEVLALIGEAVLAEHHVDEGWLPDAYSWEPTYYAEVHLVGRLLTLRL